MRRFLLMSLLALLLWPSSASSQVGQLCGSITATTNVPNSTVEISSGNTIYVTPDGCNRLAFYTGVGSNWTETFYSETSTTVTLTGTNTYDVFVFRSGVGVGIELSAAWTTPTARADALALQNGIPVKSSNKSRLYMATLVYDTATTKWRIVPNYRIDSDSVSLRNVVRMSPTAPTPNTDDCPKFDANHEMTTTGHPCVTVPGSSGQLMVNIGGVLAPITGCTSDGTKITCGAGNFIASSPIFADNIRDVNGNIVFVFPGDQTVCIINCGGAGGIKFGYVVFSGATSGSGRIGAADAAGSPNEIKIPTATGVAGAALRTDGGNPQQTSWVPTDISVKLILQSDQTISNDSLTTVLFGSSSEGYDTDTMHNTGSNTDRITFTTAGKYHVCAGVSFDANTTGERQVFLVDPSDAIVARVTIPTATIFQNAGNICTDYNASAASYLRVNIYQNSGGDLNAKAISTFFSAHKFN